MSEAVEILIKADDQASAKLADVGTAAQKTGRQAEQLMRSLETPAEKYNRQLLELEQHQRDGAITAEQFASAQAKLVAKLNELDEAAKKAGSGAAVVATAQDQLATKTSNTFRENTRTTKSFADLGAVLANLTGNSELSGFASQMASASERVGQFSEVSKAGTAGAFAFKLGLIGLAAGAGFAVGKWLADMIWQTKKFERAMADAKEEAKRLDDQIKSLAQTRFSEQKEDIELIRDPDEKRAAYKKLFEELQRDIATAGAVANKSKREAEEWADAWQITGNRKQYAEDAANQAKADRERVDALKAQASEIGKLIGARTQENALIRAANEAKDKSENYLDTLRQEVEYLRATREEQIKLDAARNTTEDDRGEAERLLRERDAIKAKQQAEQEAAEQRKRDAEEHARLMQQVVDDLERAQEQAREEQEAAEQKKAEDAQRELQRIEDMKAAERERLELQRIELEQGKEAAKIQELINQGIDEATAKQLAADEAELERLKQKKADEEAKAKEQPDRVKTSGPLAALSAMESRLLTRGPGSRQDEWMEDAARSLRRIMASSSVAAEAAERSEEKLGFIEENTDNTVLMVPAV